jgi:hypothetical protein
VLPGVFVDEGFRTGLGTGFYDRLRELEVLRRLASVYGTVVVYGPRGAGKSELVRYMIRRSGVGAVVVDGRRGRASLLGLRGERWRGVLEAARLLLQGVEPRPAGLAGFVEAFSRMLTSERAAYVVIDELHLLPLGGLREALASLEAAAALIAKGEAGGVRLIVTVSEGFFATAEAYARLQGYMTAYMLVEGLDCTHYHALAREYGRVTGCTPDTHLLAATVGTLPGRLPEACAAIKADMWDHYITQLLLNLDTALATLARKTKTEPWKLLETLAKLLQEPIHPLEEPEQAELGEQLTKLNILYPARGRQGITYKPQIPLYHAATLLALEKHTTSTAKLDPKETVEKAKQLTPCKPQP